MLALSPQKKTSLNLEAYENREINDCMYVQMIGGQEGKGRERTMDNGRGERCKKKFADDANADKSLGRFM